MSAILNPAFGRVITKAMARKPEDRYESVDQMLHALCPEDHSSYLPAPASLSMIGDRATSRRIKASAVERSGIAEDTFAKNSSLVDTTEDSQSQPFERPGLSVPDSLTTWMEVAGLWWQPAEGALLKPERTTLSHRVVVAVLVCVCFAVLASLTSLSANSMSPNGIFGFASSFTVLFSVTGIVVCFAFLQCLPRENTWNWILFNRIIATAIVTVATMIISYFVLPLMKEPVDDDHLPALFFGSLLIDWRCFISISRYPRVGGIKSMVALTIFFFVLLPVYDDSPSQILLGLLFIAAGVLSIQILAPHGRIGPPLSQRFAP